MNKNNGTQGGTNGWVLSIVVIALVVGGFLFFNKQMVNKTSSSPTPVTVNETKTTKTAETAVTTNSPITVDGGMFFFKPNEIKVKKGETVKITFTNVEGMHDFVIDDFNVKTKVLAAGKSETIEFVADKTGEFEFYCSVSNHQAMGMVGKLIVE